MVTKHNKGRHKTNANATVTTTTTTTAVKKKIDVANIIHSTVTAFILKKTLKVELMYALFKGLQRGTRSFFGIVCIVLYCMARDI